MTLRKSLLSSLATVAGLGCVNPSGASSCGPDAGTGLTVGMCAPDFSMPNRDGVAMTLYSQRGKVALVDISAIW